MHELHDPMLHKPVQAYITVDLRVAWCKDSLREYIYKTDFVSASVHRRWLTV